MTPKTMSITDLAMLLFVVGEMGFLAAWIGSLVPMPGIAYAVVCLSLATIGIVCVVRNYLDAHEITDAELDAFLDSRRGKG